MERSKTRDVIDSTLMVLLLGMGIPGAGNLLAEAFLPGWRFFHPGIHSLLEGIGGFVALSIGFVLLNIQKREPERLHYVWVSCALFGMGLLDIFHAALSPGKIFVWYHSTAKFVGGVLFLLVWLPDRWAQKAFRVRLPQITLVAVFVFIVVSRLSPGWIPEMLQQESFTRAAATLNILGGLGFLSAACYFLIRFQRGRAREDLLFATLCLLFGSAGILFDVSTLWDASWWLWHGLRLLAYCVVLSFAVCFCRKLDDAVFRLTHSLKFYARELERSNRELRKNRESVLHQNRLILESVGEGVFGLDREGHTTFINAAASRMLGHPPDEVLGKPLRSCFNPPPSKGLSFSAGECPILRSTRLGEVHRRSNEVFRKKDGTPFPVEFMSTPIEEDGNLKGAVVVFRDISERLEAEEALRSSELRSRMIIETAHDGFVGLDVQGRITDWNFKAEKTFQWRRWEVLGQDFSDRMVIPEHRDRFRDEFKNVLEKKQDSCFSKRKEFKAQHKDGSEFFVELTFLMVRDKGRWGVLLFVDDITQRKMIQAQLNHVQKMESIGHLAAGIAHEINTPIQFIGSNLQFLQEVFKNLTPLLEEVSTLVHRPPPGTLNSKSLDPLKKRYEESELDYWVTEMPLSIHQSLEGVEQVAKIVKAVKEFSHPPPEEKTWVDLNRAVENTVLVSRNEWKYVAELETDLDPNLPPVACLEDQIKQVLLNLIVNAAHAIEERKDRPAHQKGQITLSTRREGDGVEIRVSDSGQGIPKAIRSKIFDPFFTTKEVGQGTGQGLAITHAIIVNKHGGTITVESEEGRGSTFRIRLPLGMAPKEPADPPPAEVVRPLPLKSETL